MTEWSKHRRMVDALRGVQEPHYRTEATMVDWSGKLEVTYPDGRIVEAKPYNDDGHAWPDDDGQYHIDAGGMLLFANEDGSNHFPELYGGGWTIRNTPQAPSQPRTAPSQENSSGEVFERMKALTEALSGVDRDCALGLSGYASEARAIMALLAPVDGDLVEARRLARNFAPDSPKWSGILEGEHDSSPAVTHLLAAIKRGRQLERGGE